MSYLLEARNLVRTYQAGGIFRKADPVKAVDGVSLTIKPGETLGIVGESGCGKSTLGRMLLGIDDASEGQVFFDGKPLPPRNTPEWRKLRAQMQLVFQDPLAALDRRLTIASQIGEPLQIHGMARGTELKERIEELMISVGLRRDQRDRYPHELSGGQRQRVIIARALATSPRLLVCDEPVSALDVSIQAQVVNLLRDLQERHGVAMVFISHDLKVVRNICDRVAVMYLGKIVEEASSGVIFETPQHPYTKALVSSVPVPGKRLEHRMILKGEPPNPANRPDGCVFHPRCPMAGFQCPTTMPDLEVSGYDRRTACHFVEPVKTAA
ncbi:ABC transporter ATP-binding protein [Brucella pseudogrignonensis]|jgi:peptide/nickel transport system ATP-binding protein|uniref:ABC transporter ATP-binding protein n=1 Tax=Brucella pseudogrignonensis TaxID=419475 RepID=A0A256GJK5_9HYPH|nr:ABC transporter ATP-binding protein [Brucella pseudogrignonensis]EMG55608.1 oligopeptide/dipeptide ABC transporter ATPase [Ochrobactrum sp. CDB2]NNV21510.1 ABC transporter ATP-binding protein [Brucella pseudogrignonensis]OYR27354.1 oligopeptide/dipeptide ABC transporter, ATP-binding, C-terminal domain protein [Brucella pseudogrignonensis]